MKTISDHLRTMFQGKLETITATELKHHMGDCLSQTAAGKSFCIKRKGKIVAFLVHASCADVTHEIAPDGGCESLPTKESNAGDKDNGDPMTQLTQEDHAALLAGEKTCGECNGKRFITTPLTKSYRCPVCLGYGKYTYTPKGQRVAWDAKGKEWRTT